MRVKGDDMIHLSGKYIPEDALESFRNSNGTDTPKSLSLKKLGEGDNNAEINVISSHNDFTDRVRYFLQHIMFAAYCFYIICELVRMK
jgi:hypothetical protein